MNEENERTTISDAMASSGEGMPLFLMPAWIAASGDGGVFDIAVGDLPSDAPGGAAWVRCLIAVFGGRGLADRCGLDADTAVRWAASAIGGIPEGIPGGDCAAAVREAAGRTTDLLGAVEEVLADPDGLDLVVMGTADRGSVIVAMPGFLAGIEASGGGAHRIGPVVRHAAADRIPWAPMHLRVPTDAAGLPPASALESGRWRIIGESEAASALSHGPDPTVWIGAVFSGAALRCRMAADAFGAVDDILSTLDASAHLDGDPDGTNAFEADYDMVMDALDALRESPAGFDLGFFLCDGDGGFTIAAIAPFADIAARTMPAAGSDGSTEGEGCR